MSISLESTDSFKLPSSIRDGQARDGGTMRRKASLYRKQTIFEQDEPPFVAMVELLERVGFFGRYQMFCCIITMYSAIFWTTNYLLLMHPTLTNTYSCYDPITGTNHSDLESHGPYFCEEIKNCTILQPVRSSFISVLDEWKLFCDKNSLSYLVLLPYLLGRIIGCFLGGILGDNLGRVWGLMCLQAVLLVSSMMSIASTTWHAFIAFQFFNGIIFGDMRVMCSTLLVESADKKYRTFTHMCFQKSLGFIINALLAILMQHWRMHIIMMNLLASPLLYFYLLYQESYRWLISTGKIKKSLDVISELNSDRWMKTRQPEIYESQLEMIPHHKPRKTPYTLLDMVKVKRWRHSILLLVNLHFLCGIMSAVFYPYDDGHYFNVHFHLVLLGVLSLLLSLVFVIVDAQVSKFGHRPILLVCLTIMSVCFIGLIVYQLKSSPSRITVLYILKFISITINESVYHMIIFHATTATFSTVVRCHAYGLFHVCYDIGIIFMTALLFNASDSAIHPFLIGEVVVITGGILSYFYFPETKYTLSKKLLPDTLPDTPTNPGIIMSTDEVGL